MTGLVGSGGEELLTSLGKKRGLKDEKGREGRGEEREKRTYTRRTEIQIRQYVIREVKRLLRNLKGAK